MEDPLGDATLFHVTLFHEIVNGFRLVVSIRVQCLIRDDVVLQKSLEVFLTISAKEEAVDPGTKLLEGEVGGGEECSTDMIRGVCDSGQKAGLCEAEFQGTEFAGEELNDAGDLRWWDQ